MYLINNQFKYELYNILIVTKKYMVKKVLKCDNETKICHINKKEYDVFYT